MATEGPNSPGTVVSDNSYGNNTWSNPGNAAASDDTRADAATFMDSTEYLKATNFGFSIPSGATVDGIEVFIERRDINNPGGSMDDRVRIVKGGTVGSTDKADGATEWPTTDGTATYGSSSDKWGETWTRTDINATDFGMVLASTDGGGSGAPEVDHISITVHYTLPPRVAVTGARTVVSSRTVVSGARTAVSSRTAVS